MSTRIKNVRIHNFRSLADVSVELGPIGVLFGPNGSGKSTFLDSLWFIRDCAIRGVELASSDRSHGIGILYDGAVEGDERIELEIGTDDVRYSLRFDLVSGRIDSAPGEQLVASSDDRILIERAAGESTSTLYHDSVKQLVPIQLREPEKLTLNTYLNFNPSDHEAGNLDRLLHYVRFYPTRSFFLYRLRTRGSDSSHDTRLWERGDNAWSVLRNLHDKQTIDERYETIMAFMREAFPSFDGIVIEQTGPNSVYASFLEKGRRHAIQASGVSDGHLQLLLILTALFSEGPDREALLLFDEPEISLHPWALAVLAKAAKIAATEWNKQVLIATHSPVLISQFDTDSILAAEVIEGQTRLQRVSEMEGIQDLLDQYAAGSLYMSQMIGAQAETAVPIGSEDE